jgi:hypothetical protein
MGELGLAVELHDAPAGRAGEGREQRRLRALRALSESTRTARSTEECLTLAARALENVGADAWLFASGRLVARAGARFEAPAIDGAIADATWLGRRVVVDDARAGTLFVFPIGPAVLAVVGAEDDVAFHELVDASRRHREREGARSRRCARHRARGPRDLQQLPRARCSRAASRARWLQPPHRERVRREAR